MVRGLQVAHMLRVLATVARKSVRTMYTANASWLELQLLHAGMTCSNTILLCIGV